MVLVKVRPLGADRNLAELEAVGQDRPQGGHAPLEVTKCGASATVPRDLLVMVAGDANS